MQPTQSETRSSNSSDDGGARRTRRRPSLSLASVAVRLGGLMLIDAVAIWFIYALIGNGVWPAAVVVLVVTGLINWIYLDDRIYPIRWLTPGLLLMLLMVIYPLVFTLYIALTNYSDGHILTKEEVVNRLQGQYYQPADTVAYKWTAYRNREGKFLLIFEDPQGNKFLRDETGEEVKPFDNGPLPENIDGYQKLERLATTRYVGELKTWVVRQGPNLIRLGDSVGVASYAVRKYIFDPATDNLTDNETGIVYRPVRGTFTAPDGKTISPGFNVVVGFENYSKVLTDPNIRGPFLGVFLWTIIFAFLSVLFTFAVGLGLALVLNDPKLPFRAFFRSIMIIPYTIPAVISVLIWVGLLNPIYGQASQLLKSVGIEGNWFADGTWAKAGILLVQTWLGFPYMMLLCLGALQSIPTDMYEAADIDGARPWTKFRALTLPLLLVSIAPLLIGSFAFNFNNFAVIELYAQGGPPIAGVSTPAGQTDILISYTYRLAFAGGQGADYGLASAIALFIFVIIASVTAFNFRYTRQLEELT
jgi:ABC-type sugar transport system permease subunit